MKILFALFVLANLLPALSQACTNGDPSKVLLVLRESEDGEQDKVIGEIKTADSSVTITSASYTLLKSSGDGIAVEGLSGQHFAFQRQRAYASHFCYKVIYGEAQE